MRSAFRDSPPTAVSGCVRCFRAADFTTGHRGIPELRSGRPLCREAAGHLAQASRTQTDFAENLNNGIGMSDNVDSDKLSD